MNNRRIRRYGSAAWLIECDASEVTGLLAAIDSGLPSVTEATPGARSLLVRYDPAATDADDLARQLKQLTPKEADPASEEIVTLPVSYTGPDLQSAASACGLTVNELISRHHAPIYSVAFCGFAPGFAYLTGLDSRLQLPRRSSPRSRVEPGSVAIAAEYSAVYPSASPGGWHLLGNCPTVLFSIDRDPPAVLLPGKRVKFVPLPGSPGSQP